LRKSWGIIFLILIITACQPENRYGEESIFRFNIPEGITSLDPAFANNLGNIDCVNQLFNGLVQMDENLNVKPCIAKSWEVLDSNTTYRFTLRSDVTFHESEIFGDLKTRSVKAQDFVYSFNRLIKSELIAPGKWVFNIVERKPDETLNVVAVNDSILEVKLKEPFPPFLGILSMQYCAVVPKEAVEFYGDKFRANPIGTGAFRFQYWKENSKLILLKNPNYFEKNESGESLPNLDAISIGFIKDQEVAFLLFLKGELDYLSGLKGSYKDELLNSRGELREKYKAKMDLITSPYLNTEYLGFLLDTTVEVAKNNPLLNRNLRLAINYGFDREKMLEYLRNGIGQAANSGFVPKGLPSFDEKKLKGYNYNPDKAKQFLAQAGYPNGKGLETIVISTTAEYLDICEYMQHQLGELGIMIKIDVNPPATSNELVANSQLRFFRKSWVADYPDAENYLSLFKSSNFAPSGPNYTHYSNSKYDQLFNETLTISNDSLRNINYLKLDSMIVSDAPVVPLFYDQVVRFIPKYVSNIGVNPLNLLELKHAEKLNN
jgi:peptide/nickel transport system substrate-binding protein